MAEAYDIKFLHLTTAIKAEAAALDKNIDVDSTTGMAAEEAISIVLDNASVHMDIITSITDFVAKKLDDKWYFYADITTGDDILLTGKTYLTQFTTDASLTELSSGQADVVALLAASILYRNLSGLVNATDSGRFDSLANRYEQMWEAKKVKASMPVLTSEKLDWSWLNE